MLLRITSVSVLGAAIALCAPLVSLSARQQPPQQAPVFRSTVELVRVDVSVVSHDGGAPILGLGVDDFEVWLDGRKRRVVSAELESFAHDPAGPDRTPSGEVQRFCWEAPARAPVGEWTWSIPLSGGAGALGELSLRCPLPGLAPAKGAVLQAVADDVGRSLERMQVAAARSERVS